MYQHLHFYHVTNKYLLLIFFAYFMISEFWTFGLQNLFVRTREPFFSNLRTFGLKNLRTHEPSNLRTFGLIGCNRLRRIANIKWQDMIPNTEVLHRCAQNGIEHHIKRAHLRWSEHLVRMADDRIPKTRFYGERGAGHRTRGGQRKRYKDVLKATLKSCGIPHTTWEATATDRSLWRSTCHSGLRDYEEKRCDALRDKRMRRKAIIHPSTNIDTFVCQVCGRICASRIGLHSHNRTHANTNTD